MLLDLWAWIGNVGLGTFTGGGFAILVMTNWYYNLEAPNAYRWDMEGTPHYGLFFLHVAVALIGGMFVGLHMYRWGEKRVENYDAEVLYDRWIKKRLKKEMAQFKRRP
jgi:hypothetical protein